MECTVILKPTPKAVDVIYTRQSYKKELTLTQVKDLSHWEKRHSSAVWFDELYEPGSTDRPVWKEVERLLKEGLVKRLIVWRVDRLGMTSNQFVELMVMLHENEIGFVSVKDKLTLDSVHGRRVINTIASMVVYEKEVRSERISAGIKKAGVPKRNMPKGPSKKVKRLVPQILDLHGRGFSASQIANAVSLSKMTIYRVLWDNEAMEKPEHIKEKDLEEDAASFDA